MADLRYLVGTRGHDLSKPLPLGEAYDRIGAFVQHPNRQYRMRRRGSDWGAVRNGRATWDRLREIVPNLNVGDALLVQHIKSGETWVMRPAEIGLTAADTPGLPAIDLMWAYVFERWDDRFGITNLGICVNKPGEHGKCNAWDIGVHKPNSSDDIHSAIRVIANDLRVHGGSGADSPIAGKVNGIIVMYEWCEYSGSGMTTWQAYHGTPHVTHVHVSGLPNPVPGWI